MIDLYTLYPKKLNLNGDQANLHVIGMRLSWLGCTHRVVELNSLADVEHLAQACSEDPQGKFLLIGHGSKAAVDSLEDEVAEIRNLVIRAVGEGLTGLAVGSGYELVHPDFSRGERISDYANLPARGALPETFGYINSDTDLAPIIELGPSFVGTLVHGPVLARTPELADLLISKLGVQVTPNERSAEVDAFALAARNH